MLCAFMVDDKLRIARLLVPRDAVGAGVPVIACFLAALRKHAFGNCAPQSTPFPNALVSAPL